MPTYHILQTNPRIAHTFYVDHSLDKRLVVPILNGGQRGAIILAAFLGVGVGQTLRVQHEAAVEVVYVVANLADAHVGWVIREGWIWGGDGGEK